MTTPEEELLLRMGLPSDGLLQWQDLEAKLVNPQSTSTTLDDAT